MLQLLRWAGYKIRREEELKKFGWRWVWVDQTVLAVQVWIDQTSTEVKEVYPSKPEVEEKLHEASPFGYDRWEERKEHPTQPGTARKCQGIFTKILWCLKRVDSPTGRFWNGHSIWLISYAYIILLFLKSLVISHIV